MSLLAAGIPVPAPKATVPQASNAAAGEHPGTEPFASILEALEQLLGHVSYPMTSAHAPNQGSGRGTPDDSKTASQPANPHKASRPVPEAVPDTRMASTAVIPTPIARHERPAPVHEENPSTSLPATSPDETSPEPATAAVRIPIPTGPSPDATKTGSLISGRQGALENPLSSPEPVVTGPHPPPEPAQPRTSPTGATPAHSETHEAPSTPTVRAVLAVPSTRNLEQPERLDRRRPPSAGIERSRPQLSRDPIPVLEQAATPTADAPVNTAPQIVASPDVPSPPAGPAPLGSSTSTPRSVRLGRPERVVHRGSAKA